MEPQTHLGIDADLCGVPLELREGVARVELKTSARMLVDPTGLVHGGFVFGLADYAAMLAVNHPNVVLGSADTRFVKPVQVGDRVVADAEVVSVSGTKRDVRVAARVGSDVVFEGTLVCFVPERHVLESARSK